ncbi:TauD/TfdA family dioxygenase [Nonomuraea glycinis]|nr:TauD/TfdA family dioxygenase [Nonomuraea glycinis]MCA2177717.1 TauD/TfdA family dioxygenase [Nonomuraea glycinis]
MLRHQPQATIVKLAEMACGGGAEFVAAADMAFAAIGRPLSCERTGTRLNREKAWRKGIAYRSGTLTSGAAGSTDQEVPYLRSGRSGNPLVAVRKMRNEHLRGLGGMRLKAPNGQEFRIDQAQDGLTQHGIILFSGATLNELKSALNDWTVPYRHPHDISPGVTVIRPKLTGEANAKGFTYEALPLHTDRAQVDNQPTIIGCLYTQEAADGGESLLVDGAEIVDAMFARRLEYIRGLHRESVFSGHPEAVFKVHTEKFPPDSADTVLICTDGFARCIVDYKILRSWADLKVDVHRHGLKEITSRIRKYEAQDRSNSSPTKFEQSDDLAAIILAN